MIDYLHKHGYYVIENFFTKTQSDYFFKQSIDTINNKEMAVGDIADVQAFHPKTWNVNSHPIWQNTLYTMLPVVSKLIKEDLIPTYAYQRIYLKGSKMSHHTDWPFCQISMTINIGQSDPYPIYVTDMDTKESVEVIQNPGDAVIYLGHNVSHYRNEFKGKFYSQLFLHYVINNKDMLEFDRFDAEVWRFELEEDYKFLYPKKIDKSKEGVDYTYDMQIENKDKVLPLDGNMFSTTNKMPDITIEDLDTDIKLKGGQYDTQVLEYFKDSMQQTKEALTPEFCNELIDIYDKEESKNQIASGATHSGVNESIKDTGEIDLMKTLGAEEHVKTIIQVSDGCIMNYLEKFGLDKHYDVSEIYRSGVYYPMWETHKYQKGKGHYNSWHTEGSHMYEFGNRIFTSMFYLNDVEEGGRTVFPFSRLAIKAEQGKHFAFPTMWPYVHYAQTPISGDKYILTTWLQTQWPEEYTKNFVSLPSTPKHIVKEKIKFLFEKT